MGRTNNIIHPSKARRELARISEERADHMHRVATQKKINLLAQKENTLTNIIISANEARTQIDTWYQNEYAAAKQKLACMQIEHAQELDFLEATLYNANEDVGAGYLAKKEQLHNKLIVEQETVADRYPVAMHNLDQDLHSKHKILHKDYVVTLEVVKRHHANLIAEQECYIFSLQITRDTNQFKVIMHQTQAHIQLETQYQADETALATEINRALKDNSQEYRDSLDHMRNVYQATLINGFVAIAAAAAAWATGGLSVTFGAYIAETIQGSLAMTSIAAAERAAHGSDAVGVNFNSNLTLAPSSRNGAHNFTIENTSSNRNQSHDHGVDNAQRRFQQTVNQVRIYASDYESASPNSNNQVAIRSANSFLTPSKSQVRQNSNHYTFTIQVNFALVQENKLRADNWNIRFNQQTYSFANNNQPIKLYMRQFLANLDPNLTRNANDGLIMAELKMYDRIVKNTRDGVVQLVTNPVAVLRDGFIAGADVIEAGLHFLGKDYYPAAQQRNQARVQAIKALWNADGLTQREVIGTLALQSWIIAPTSGVVAEAGGNAVVIGRAAATKLANASPITFQFEAGRLYSGFPIDAIKLKGRGASNSAELNKGLVDKASELKQPVNANKLTKGQIIDYLHNVDKVPIKQLANDLKRLGFELLEQRPERNIYKFSHVKNNLRETNQAKANLESSKIMVELHLDHTSGPHMHITDSLGNVYDKRLNNLTVKFRQQNPYLAEKIIEKRVERLTEAHISIKELFESKVRLSND